MSILRTFRKPTMDVEYDNGIGVEVWHIGWVRKYRSGYWYQFRLPWSARIPVTDHGCLGSNDLVYGLTKRSAIRKALQRHGCLRTR